MLATCFGTLLPPVRVDVKSRGAVMAMLEPGCDELYPPSMPARFEKMKVIAAVRGACAIMPGMNTPLDNPGRLTGSHAGWVHCPVSRERLHVAS